MVEFGNKNPRVVLHKIINSQPRKNTLPRAFDHDVADEIMSYNKILKKIINLSILI